MKTMLSKRGPAPTIRWCLPSYHNNETGNPSDVGSLYAANLRDPPRVEQESIRTAHHPREIFPSASFHILEPQAGVLEPPLVAPSDMAE